MDLSETVGKAIRLSLGVSSLDIYMGREVDRLLIREFLYSRFPEQFESRESVLDLSKPPVSVFKSISISHCPGHTGVLIGNRSDGLFGLDLELVTRVKEPVARRVALEGEIEATPSFAHLWVAKEAFYKALPKTLQSTTISQLLISHWKQLGENSWTFSATTAAGNLKGLGLVILENSDLAIGVAHVSNELLK